MDQESRLVTPQPSSLGFLGPHECTGLSSLHSSSRLERLSAFGSSVPSLSLIFPLFFQNVLQSNTLCVPVFVVVVVQSLSCVQPFAIPWTAAHQTSLSFTDSQSLLRLMSIKLVMPSNHLICCHPLLFLPSIFPNIRVFSNESALCIGWPKYWSFSFSISTHVKLLII